MVLKLKMFSFLLVCCCRDFFGFFFWPPPSPTLAGGEGCYWCWFGLLFKGKKQLAGRCGAAAMKFGSSPVCWP